MRRTTILISLSLLLAACGGRSAGTGGDDGGFVFTDEGTAPDQGQGGFVDAPGPDAGIPPDLGPPFPYPGERITDQPAILMGVAESGDWLAWWDGDSSLYATPVAGGDSALVTEVLVDASFVHDVLVVSEGFPDFVTGLSVWKAGFDEAVELSDSALFGADVAPDSAHVVFTEVAPDDTGDLVAVGVDGGDPTAFVEGVPLFMGCFIEAGFLSSDVIVATHCPVDGSSDDPRVLVHHRISTGATTVISTDVMRSLGRAPTEDLFSYVTTDGALHVADESGAAVADIDTGVSGRARFTPDGTTIAYPVEAGEIRESPAGGGTPVAVVDGAFVRGFSNDSQWVVYSLDIDFDTFLGDLGIARLDASESWLLADTTGAQPVGFTPDDDFYVWAGDLEIFGGGQALFTAFAHPAGDGDTVELSTDLMAGPRLAATGDVVLVGGVDLDDYSGDLRAVDPATGDATTLAPDVAYRAFLVPPDLDVVVYSVFSGQPEENGIHLLAL